MKHLDRIGTLTDKQSEAFTILHMLCNLEESVDESRIGFVVTQIIYIRQEIKRLALESSKELNLSQLRKARLLAIRELSVLKKSSEKIDQIKKVCLKILAINQVFIEKVRSSKKVSLGTIREADKIDHVLNNDPND